MSTISMTSAVLTKGESLFILFVSHVHNIHDISSNYWRRVFIFVSHVHIHDISSIYTIVSHVHNIHDISSNYWRRVFIYTICITYPSTIWRRVMTSAVITEGESLFILFVSHVHNIHDISSNYWRRVFIILFVSHVHNIHDISSNYWRRVFIYTICITCPQYPWHQQ